MSTSSHFDSEIISYTVRAQSSRVPTPLPGDPYVVVRQAHLVNTDNESGPLEDLRETEIPQPLLVVPSPVLSSDDLHLTVGQAHTPATIDTESEPEEAPSEIEEFLPLVSRTPLTNEEFEALEPSNTRTTSPHSSASSDSTAPLSPDHPLTQTSPTPTPTRVLFHRRTTCMTVRAQPAMSPGLSARVTKAMILSDLAFRKRYRSSYKTPSPSLTLPVRKRYRCTSELILDTETEDDELEAQGAGSVLVEVTTAYRPLGLGYEAARHRTLELAKEIAPSTFEVGQSSRSVPDQQVADETPTPRIPMRTTWINPEDSIVYLDIEIDPRSCAPVQTSASPEWSSGSLPVLPASLTIPSPIASLVTTPATTITVDEDEFLEVGAQLELHGSILHDHTQRLDALPPTLLEGYDRDLKELYTRSRAARDEIFSQRYRLRSLEQEQERATVTFGSIWRPVLALESWAGHVNTHRVEMWQARYDDHRLIHDMLVQHTVMQRELQEMRDRVASLEQERSRKEQ
ncbi:hypothetical protein Tco_0728287 [Tanacetum coccineum]|uniref:Uncharacterized protein n=1 Tax=Tanacetum coccineum TaxID=301880 RepID=A0ABQ4YN12_9ASTR